MSVSINNLSAPYIDQLIYVVQQTPIVNESKIAKKKRYRMTLNQVRHSKFVIRCLIFILFNINIL